MRSLSSKIFTQHAWSKGWPKAWTKPLLALMLFTLTACASNTIYESIEAYDKVRGQIALGQSKDAVLSVLAPAQRNLHPAYAKTSESYRENGKTREIYFFRSRSFNDGIVTDDEFTPYVFDDDVLVAIGWTAIGGPKTQAQTRDTDRDLHIHGRYFYW